MGELLQASAAQGDTENCVAHNGSLIPVPGRDIEVQAWYQGGVSVMDFTDATIHSDCLTFDLGPIDPKCWCWAASVGLLVQRQHLRRRIARGLDVFELTPTKSDARTKRRGQDVGF